MFIFPAKYSI